MSSSKKAAFGRTAALGEFRDECLRRNFFENPVQTKEVIEKHRIFYNTKHKILYIISLQ